MATTLTICRNCLLQAGGGGTAIQERLNNLRQRIEVQLGPVDLQLEDCLHHCCSQEVCVRLHQSEAARDRWTHVKPEESFRDPAADLLKR